jgi:hypothetical protein
VRKKTLAVSVIDRLIIAAVGPLDPSDKDWQGFLDVIRAQGIERTMLLVYSAGGALNATRRQEFTALLAGHHVPVAVLSNSVSFRTSIYMLSLFNRKIQGFPSSALADALAYLEIPVSRLDLIDRELRKLREDVGPT